MPTANYNEYRSINIPLVKNAARVYNERAHDKNFTKFVDLNIFVASCP